MGCVTIGFVCFKLLGVMRFNVLTMVSQHGIIWQGAFGQGAGSNLSHTGLMREI